jgi:hypothetical protein
VKIISYNSNTIGYQNLLKNIFIFNIAILCFCILLSLSLKQHWFVEHLINGVKSIVATSFFYIYIKKNINANLPIFFVFQILFIAYILKFYLLILVPNHIISINWIQKFPRILEDYNSLFYCYELVSTSFLISSILIFVPLKPRSKIYKKTIYSFNPRLFLLVSFILIVITNIVMFYTKSGTMGSESVYLPYKLSGIIYYLRILVIPAILLHIITNENELSNLSFSKYATFCLIFLGISEVLLRASRGALLNIVVLLFFTKILKNRFSKKHVIFCVVFGIITALCWPIISYYREYRIYADGHGQALQLAVEHSLKIHPINYLSFGAISMFNRIAGIEHLLGIIALDFRVAGSEIFMPGVTMLYTWNVWGFDQTAAHGSATGILGWFYAAGGSLFVVMGLSLYLKVIQFMQVYIFQSNINHLNSSYLIFILFVVLTTVGGSIDGAIELILILFVFSKLFNYINNHVKV